MEIQKGIELIGEKLENPSLDTLIAIHPYFSEGTQNPLKPLVGENYPQVRNRILDEWKDKGNIVFFEMDNEYWLNKLLERINLSFKKGIYVIPTEYWGIGASSTPSRTDWDSVVNFLRSLSKNFKFMGGSYIKLDREYKPLQGCLGNGITALAERGITGQLIEEACFR